MCDTNCYCDDDACGEECACDCHCACDYHDRLCDLPKDSVKARPVTFTMPPITTVRNSTFESKGSGFVTKDSGARQDFDTGARRDVQDGKPRYDLIPTHALRRVADLYARGAEKYGDNNWQKGIPFSRCLSPLERHLHQFKQGETDEDHLAAVVWNALAIMHYQEVGPAGLDDLPHDERLS